MARFETAVYLLPRPSNGVRSFLATAAFWTSGSSSGIADIAYEPSTVQNLLFFRKKHLRLGPGTSPDEVARKELLFGDVRQTLTASQKARDCLGEK